MIYHTERLKSFSDCGRTIFFLRVSNSSKQIHKVLKPFSVVNFKGTADFLGSLEDGGTFGETGLSLRRSSCWFS